MLRGDEAPRALDELTELQSSVTREYDELRRYARSLAGVGDAPAAAADDAALPLTLRADVTAAAAVVDHALAIAREGLLNVRRHARATAARIHIHGDGDGVHVDIDDDGVGFAAQAIPWTIASRARHAGGQVRVDHQTRPGAHVSVTLPSVRS